MNGGVFKTIVGAVAAGFIIGGVVLYGEFSGLRSDVRNIDTRLARIELKLDTQRTYSER